MLSLWLRAKMGKVGNGSADSYEKRVAKLAMHELLALHNLESKG